MPKEHLRYYFLLLGLLDAVALLAAFFYSLKALDIYFSYFTVLSNILITSIFLYFGLGNRHSGLTRINPLVLKLYGPAVLYMSITGTIFWTVLRHNHAIQTIPWINLTLHGIMPIAAIVGWLLFSPKKKLAWKDALIWQIPPLLFVFYTLLHGPVVHWYPYPFLNPNIVGGYSGVALWVAGIITGSVLLSLLLIHISNSKK